MPSDTDPRAALLLPRHLFGDMHADLLFEPLGTGTLVPAALLAAGIAPAAVAFVTAETVAAPAAPAVDAQAPAASAGTTATTTAAGTLPAAIAASLDGADQAVQGAAARLGSGVSGSGVIVGILSDSFNLHGGYAGDVSQGLLNPGVTVLKEGPAGGHDEGRAMAQLIHQIAPDAQIMFYSAFNGPADFATGIQALANAGASIIVDDVTYLNEPFYQDGGAIQQAVEQVVASGVSYFTSASNQGGNFYENAFTPLYTGLPGISGGFVAANFGTAAAPSPYVNLTIAHGATATIDLQWDEPFASIGGTGAATSLGMVLYDQSGHIVAYALRSAIGGDPVALMQFTNTGTSTSFHMAIITDGGRGVPGQFKFIAYGQGTTINDPHAGIGSGTIIGHEMVPEANTVGAVAYGSTAAFGGSNTLESFSSVGPGEFLFDAQGNRLASPLQGAGIDYVAPDGSATSVFNPFYGTSAAAPNAAGVAALMLQNSPNLTPAQVSAALAGSALAASGPSSGTGAGLIQASEAVKSALALAGPAGRANSFVLPASATAASGALTNSAAIGSAATSSSATGSAAGIAATLDSQPPVLSDFVAVPDLASGLVDATGDSLAGASYASLALMNGGAPPGDALYDPVHLLGLSA